MNRNFVLAFAAFIMVLCATLLIGCNPNVANGSTTITVTVTGDEHTVVNEPAAFQVNNGTQWKDVKMRISVAYASGFEAAGWNLGNKDGMVLTDDYRFTENATVFAVSKPTDLNSTVMITVNADEGFELHSEHTLTVAADSQWKNIKTRAEGIVTLKDGYRAAGWKLDSAEGAYLDDEDTFTKDQTIYAVSEKDTDPAPVKITITVTGDEGYIVKDGASFEVKKDTLWKDIKKRAQKKVMLKETYETFGWKIESAYLEDNTALTKNVTITAVSKRQGAPAPVTITVTVQGDEGVEVSSNNAFTIEANAEWQNIKIIAESKISFKAGYEGVEWHLGDKTGEILTDTKIFTGGETVFAASKRSLFTTDGNGTITGYTCAKNELPATLVIPAKIGKEDITVIGSGAFDDCLSLTNITLPESLTEIGSGAFSHCTALISIHIPDSVTRIGSSAFWYCTSLISAPLPRSLKTLGEMAFFNCKKLTAVTLPEPLTEIGTAVFSGCVNLTTLTVDEANQNFCSVNNIVYTKNKDILLFPAGSITNAAIPEGVTSIDFAAFSDCQNLTTVTFPESLTEICRGAFLGCISLTSINFSACTKLSELDRASFHSCTALTSVTLPEGLLVIGREAFAGCKNLTTVNLPTSIKLIGESAFSGCTGLTGIDFSPCTNLIALNAFAFASTGLISVDLSPCTSCTFIGTDAFMRCSGLTNVKLPPNLTELHGGFFKCINLTSINLSSCTQLSVIGSGVFQDCTGLTSFDLSPFTKLTKIGYNAFSGCTNLANITLPQNLTTIGGGAFFGCKELTTITFPASLVNIGGPDNDGYWENESSAFQNCEKLQTVDFSACTQFTALKEKIFYDCSSLTNIILPQNLIAIHKEAFSRCTALTDIDLSSCTDLTVINENAFSDCSALTNVDLSHCTDLITISDGSFSYCTDLANITLPHNLTTIGRGAFSACTNAEIKLPESITTLDKEAFGYYYGSIIGEHFCKKVLIKAGAQFDRIKKLVIDSGYPVDRIDSY